MLGRNDIVEACFSIRFGVCAILLERIVGSQMSFSLHATDETSGPPPMVTLLPERDLSYNGVGGMRRVARIARVADCLLLADGPISGF